jgi:DHA1 family bicyclomycin/chloramphenicol resistance-like MFS transporter
MTTYTDVPGDLPALPHPHRVRLIVILGALSAFAPLSIDMYLPGLPSLAHDLNGQPSEVQLTLTACLVGLALGQLLAGPMSDTFGRRRPLMVGLAAYSVASFLCVFAASAPQLVGLRFIQGLGGAAGIVIARAIVRDLYSGVEAAHFFSLLLLVNGLAPILAPVLGGQVLRFSSWRGVFLVLAAIGVVLLVAAYVGLAETVPRERRRAGGVPDTMRTFSRLLRDRTFVGFALTGGFSFAGVFAYISASPFVLENIYGVSPQLFGVLFGINAIGIMVAAQTGGRLVRRVGPRPLLIAGMCISATGALVLVLTTTIGFGLPGVLPAFFLVASGMGLILPNGMALALTDHARVAGSASALIGTTQYMIGGLAAPLVGVAGSHSAVPVTVIIATMSVAGLLAYFLLASQRRSTNATAG